MYNQRYYIRLVQHIYDLSNLIIMFLSSGAEEGIDHIEKHQKTEFKNLSTNFLLLSHKVELHHIALLVLIV